jgi:hypothetical protein
MALSLLTLQRKLCQGPRLQSKSCPNQGVHRTSASAKSRAARMAWPTMAASSGPRSLMPRMCFLGTIRMCTGAGAGCPGRPRGCRSREGTGCHAFLARFGKTGNLFPSVHPRENLTSASIQSRKARFPSKMGRLTMQGHS